jgi:hypothetical protein
VRPQALQPSFQVCAIKRLPTTIRSNSSNGPPLELKAKTNLFFMSTASADCNQLRVSLDRLKYDLTASAEVLEALTPGFVAERLPRRADGASAPIGGRFSLSASAGIRDRTARRVENDVRKCSLNGPMLLHFDFEKPVANS